MKMISIKTTNGKDLRTIFSGISTLAPELEIEFDDIGMKASTMATGNISAIFFRILKLNFSEYTFEAGDKVIIRLQDICDILKLLKDDDILELKTSSGNAKLFVYIHGKKEKDYEIPLLIESNLNKPPRDKIENLVFSVNVFTEEFKECMDAATVIGKEKNVSFLNEKNILYLTKTDVTRKSRVQLSPSKEEGKLLSRYNSDYIYKFLASGTGCEHTLIKFGTDLPLHVEFVKQDKFKIWFFLGPIVDNN